MQIAPGRNIENPEAGTFPARYADPSAVSAPGSRCGYQLVQREHLCRTLSPDTQFSAIAVTRREQVHGWLLHSWSSFWGYCSESSRCCAAMLTKAWRSKVRIPRSTWPFQARRRDVLGPVG